MTGRGSAAGAGGDGRSSGDRRETGIRVTVGSETATGRAVDLPATVGVDPLARAVRGEPVEGVSVEAPDPGPAHEYVGVVDAPGVPLRAALTAAARSRGESAPQDDSLAECERRLASLDPPDVDAAAAKKRVAERADEETRLHERVAQLRGRVQTLRERDGDEALADAEAKLDEAVAALTEARTERIAAEQAVDRARSRARDARDVRERRLELEDRIGNLRRAARDHLAEAVFDDFRAALEAVPGGNDHDPESPADYDGDGTTAALAVARIADLDAPVVLACNRFPDATAAANALDAPVIRLASGDGR